MKFEPHRPPERVRIPVKQRAIDLDKQNPVSWAVYHTQWVGGGGLPGYSFNFTRIDSDQWSRVSGELSQWIDDEEKVVVLTVYTEPDIVEDGFVTIAHWVDELMEWARAIA